MIVQTAGNCSHGGATTQITSSLGTDWPMITFSLHHSYGYLQFESESCILFGPRRYYLGSQGVDHTPCFTRWHDVKERYYTVEEPFHLWNEGERERVRVRETISNLGSCKSLQSSWCDLWPYLEVQCLSVERRHHTSRWCVEDAGGARYRWTRWPLHLYHEDNLRALRTIEQVNVCMCVHLCVSLWFTHTVSLTPTCHCQRENSYPL